MIENEIAKLENLLIRRSSSWRSHPVQHLGVVVTIAVGVVRGLDVLRRSCMGSPRRPSRGQTPCTTQLLDRPPRVSRHDVPPRRRRPRGPDRRRGRGGRPWRGRASAGAGVRQQRHLAGVLHGPATMRCCRGVMPVTRRERILPRSGDEVRSSATSLWSTASTVGASRGCLRLRRPRAVPRGRRGSPGRPVGRVDQAALHGAHEAAGTPGGSRRRRRRAPGRVRVAFQLDRRWRVLLRDVTSLGDGHVGSSRLGLGRPGAGAGAVAPTERLDPAPRRRGCAPCPSRNGWLSLLVSTSITG